MSRYLNSSTYIRFQRIFLVILTTKNWFSAIAVWMGLLSHCLIRFRNGRIFQVDKKCWVSYLERVYLYHHFPEAKLSEEIVKLEYKGRELILHFGRYGVGTILEIFGGQPYSEFFNTVDIKGKEIIDVGAAFGDTAIMFLIAGAKYVHSVEASPSYFLLAKKNIEDNGYSDCCSMTLAAMGGAEGFLEIDENLDTMFGKGIESSAFGQKVPIVTLEQIVKKHSVRDGVLKLDVEGYEYEILLNAPVEIIRCFSNIFLEYHYGHIKIKECLERAGFAVRYTHSHPVHMEHLVGDAANMEVGNLYASRVG